MEDHWGVRLLCSAAVNRDPREVSRLLSEGIDPNGRNDAGGTALVAASMGGCLECVRLLLEAGADIHAGDGGGWTPLMYAAWGGRTECLALLLDAGSDSNARDRFGDTAEGIARLARHREAAGMLAAARERMEIERVSAAPVGGKGSRRL